jgi:hypothetical protein
MNAVRFEYRAELNILKLADELADGTYRPSRSIRFVVDKPKLREIVAADFRDRVVHHYLVERLERIYEPIFIHDSYACRTGKGVHAALHRVRDFMRKGTKNGNVPLYALHLDVKNYFMTIDKRILARMVEDRLVKVARNGVSASPDFGGYPDKGKADNSLASILPFLNNLTRIFLTHNAMDERIDKGDKRLLGRVPPHKSLLHAACGVGLPVGNLTSQFFANVYLNELDQFCKHTLKCHYYVRYCDDFLILDNDPAKLIELREQIRAFLAEKLLLQLNTRYAAITDVNNGIDFIGYIIRPDYVLVRRRSINNLRTRLQVFEMAWVHVSGRVEASISPASTLPGQPPPKAGKTDEACCAPGVVYAIDHNPKAVERLRGVMASYWGHFNHADTNRLKHSILSRYLFLKAFFTIDDSGNVTFIRKPRHNHQTLRGQCRSLAGLYLGSAVFVQVGRRYERPGRNHGGFNGAISCRKLDRNVKERLAAGMQVVIARETGQHYGRLLERMPALTVFRS